MSSLKNYLYHIHIYFFSARTLQTGTNKAGVGREHWRTGNGVLRKIAFLPQVRQRAGRTRCEGKFNTSIR